MANQPNTHDPRDIQYRIRAVRRDPTDLSKLARGLLRLVEAQERMLCEQSSADDGDPHEGT